MWLGRRTSPIKKARAERLRRLGEVKLAAYAARFIGRELEIVVEGGSKGGRLKGLSRNYLEVAFDGPAELVCKVVTVQADNAVAGKIHATLAAPVVMS